MLGGQFLFFLSSFFLSNVHKVGFGRNVCAAVDEYFPSERGADAQDVKQLIFIMGLILGRLKILVSLSLLAGSVDQSKPGLHHTDWLKGLRCYN